MISEPRQNFKQCQSFCDREEGHSGDHFKDLGAIGPIPGVKESRIDHLETKLAQQKALIGELIGNLESVRKEASDAWSYAVRHPDNGGLGIPSVISSIEKFLAKAREQMKGKL